MRCGITADIQVGSQKRLSFFQSDGITTRLGDYLECLRWIVSECVERECETLFIIGDIFQSRTAIDVSVLDQVCRVFHEASKQLRFVFSVGNHDSHLRNPAINSLQVFRGFATIIETPTVLPPFGLVPWEGDPDKLLQGIKKVAKPSVKYLLTHVLLDTFYPGVGVPVSYLSAEKFERVFLGDVHEPTRVSETVQYVGAPLAIDYGDADGDRGFVVLDTATGKREFVTNEISPRFHLFKALEDAEGIEVQEKDFVRVELSDSEDALELAEQMRQNTKNVECATVLVEDAPPRLAVSMSEERSVVLEKYVDVFDWENDAATRAAVVKAGCEFVEAAESEEESA